MPIHVRINILLAYLIFSAAALPARADTIFFKNGARLDIAGTWEAEGQIKCMLYGQEVGYPLKDVLRVEKSPAQQAPPDTGGTTAGVQAAADIRRELDILSLHNAAMELAKKGNLSAALEKEKQACRLDPGNEGVRASLGALYNSLGIERQKQDDYDGALQQFQHAAEYAPQEPQIKKNIAVVYIEMARLAMEKNNFRQAQASLDTAMAYDPLNPYIFVSSGRIAYIGNNYAKAEQDWVRALELAPNMDDVREQLQKLRKEKKLEDGFEIRERDNFSIKFEGTQNRELADTLMQVLRDAYHEVGRDFDLYPDSTVPVIVYPQGDLGQLAYFPDWAAGAYDGKIRFGENIRKQNLHMKAVLYHEYTHVLVRMAAGVNVPFWFNEGLAEYEARRFKTPRMIGSREKLLRGAQRLLTLSELADMNIPSLSKLQPQVIELAYAQSESFVTWLIEQYSFRDMRGLLARLGRGETVQAAVSSELHEELPVLEQKWREQLKDEK
jgi:tetratricopeptide (TPR) repeat protein